jgi:hypothetical protein
MKHTLHIAPTFKLLLKVFVVMCAIFICAIEATPTAFAQSCDDGCGESDVRVEAEAEADDPCAEPCPGESPEDGGCLDDCQYCSCCSTAATPALAGASMGYISNMPAFRGDLPPSFATIHGGISLRIFKPPRHLRA